MDNDYKIILEGEDVKIFIALCVSCRQSFKKVLKHHKNKNLESCDEFCNRHLEAYNTYIHEKEMEEMAD